MSSLIKASLLTVVLLAVANPSYALDIKIEPMVKEFAGGALNVRSGPGVKYKALRTIRSGTRGMKILEQKGDWVKISWGKRKHKGWVSQKYLENVYNIDGGAEYVVNTKQSPLNMRYGPSQKQRKLRALPRGTRGIAILELEKTGKTWWARVSQNNKVGWVNARYLKITSKIQPVVKLKKKEPKKKIPKKTIVKKSIDSVDDEYYEVQAGDTLFNVMRETGIQWKTLASLNDIEAPYDLYLGQELRLR